MSDRTARLHPHLRLPGQVSPVRRDASPGPGDSALAGRGVDPARSRCSQLQGLAQQMCYATEYGIST